MARASTGSAVAAGVEERSGELMAGLFFVEEG